MTMTPVLEGAYFANIEDADSINFLSKFSFRKATNALAVLSSFYLSKWTKKPIQWGLPFTVSIEPTTHCNLGCPECPSGLKSFTRPTGNLEYDFYNKMLDQIGADLFYLYFYFQGEPYLHPKFLDLVKSASAQNIYTVTSTNAHFLTERKAKETIESGLDRILISIDGTTQETYESYRIGGTLEKVIEGTNKCVVSFVFIVFITLFFNKL
jgi:MoaA/NifB/PqqE/SkfB family radical SAM enzyme